MQYYIFESIKYLFNCLCITIWSLYWVDEQLQYIVLLHPLFKYLLYAANTVLILIIIIVEYICIMFILLVFVHDVANYVYCLSSYVWAQIVAAIYNDIFHNTKSISIVILYILILHTTTISDNLHLIFNLISSKIGNKPQNLIMIVLFIVKNVEWLHYFI